MRCVWVFVLGVSIAGLAGSSFGADDPPADATVTDIDGKEVKLTGVKFTTGTRRLAWLANADAKVGPQALEVREAYSTTFTKGVLTLVPVASLESAKYDYEKQQVTLTVKGLKAPLTGTLEYKGINVLGLTGTADGKATTFSAGVLGKGAVKTATFPGAKPLPERKLVGGWAVQITHPAANNPTLTVYNLKALYQFPGGTEQLVDGIPVRKGQAIPFNAALKRFELLANDPNTNIAAAEVEAGGPEKVIAIPLTTEQDKKTGHLIGFLGEVEAGWKLFPLHTIKVITPAGEKKVD